MKGFDGLFSLKRRCRHHTKAANIARTPSYKSPNLFTSNNKEYDKTQSVCCGKHDGSALLPMFNIRLTYCIPPVTAIVRKNCF